MTPAEWYSFAEEWLAEVRGDDPDAGMGERVVWMNFTAPPELQWRFILLAVSLARSELELGHVAAGPIEHLLGSHGAGYIDRVEAEALTSRKFAGAMLGVWRYVMSDEIRSRVQALQARLREAPPERGLRPASS